MLRFLLAPRWLAWHALLVVVLVALTLLGLWQLEHFQHHQRSRADRPPATIDAVTRPGGRLAADDVARRVTAEGRYDDARTLFVPQPDHGFWAVTALQTSAGVLPVLRGWVHKPASRAAVPPSGTVRLSGRLQASQPREASAVDPLEQLPPRQIPYLSTVSLLAAWPYSSSALYDGYVVMTAEQPAAQHPPTLVDATRPSGGVARWRNLVYAVQWWLFGAAAVFFWGSVVRRAVSERRGRRR